LGLFSSESREIFDEILRYLAKPIAEGTIGEANAVYIIAALLMMTTLLCFFKNSQAFELTRSE
jgi:hypothetical protein